MIEACLNSAYVKSVQPCIYLAAISEHALQPLLKVSITLKNNVCVCPQLFQRDVQSKLRKVHTQSAACSFQGNVFLNMDSFLSLYKVLTQN